MKFSPRSLCLLFFASTVAACGGESGTLDATVLEDAGVADTGGFPQFDLVPTFNT